MTAAQSLWLVEQVAAVTKLDWGNSKSNVCPDRKTDK